MANLSEGQLVQVSGAPEVNQIIFGRRCWVPDPSTYTNLYINWNAVQTISQADFDSLLPGPQITNGAYLGKGPGGTVYLISWGMANPITSSGFATYQFTYAHIQDLSQSTLDGMPAGWMLA